MSFLQEKDSCSDSTAIVIFCFVYCHFYFLAEIFFCQCWEALLNFICWYLNLRFYWIHWFLRYFSEAFKIFNAWDLVICNQGQLNFILHSNLGLLACNFLSSFYILDIRPFSEGELIKNISGSIVCSLVLLMVLDRLNIIILPEENNLEFPF